MDDTFARLSKAGKVVCGKPHRDGGYYCDEPLAAIIKVHQPPNYPERELVALPGWRPDRMAIWRQTTSEHDRVKHPGAPSKHGTTATRVASAGLLPEVRHAAVDGC